MSLKKMHEERKESRQLSLPQPGSSNALAGETPSDLIERQRQQIELLEKQIKGIKADCQEQIAEMEDQRKRAWEEVDKLRFAPPKIEYRYQDRDKCRYCELDAYKKSSHGAWVYANFLTLMFAAGIVCEIAQSKDFLLDLLEFLVRTVCSLLFTLIGPIFSGHYLVSWLGLLERSGAAYIAGQMIRIGLPVIIYFGYFLIGKYLIPWLIDVYKETLKEYYVPRMIGLHLFSTGIVISLCCARIIPRERPGHINSMIIPVVLYVVWIVVCRYIEGCWWFKGWNE